MEYFYRLRTFNLQILQPNFKRDISNQLSLHFAYIFIIWMTILRFRYCYISFLNLIKKQYLFVSMAATVDTILLNYFCDIKKGYMYINIVYYIYMYYCHITKIGDENNWIILLKNFHFVVFNLNSEDWNYSRRAIEGVYGGFREYKTFATLTCCFKGIQCTCRLISIDTSNIKNPLMI